TYHKQHNREWFQEDYEKKHLIIHGFFQNAKYYNNKKEIIKKFFILPPIDKRPPTDVVIHYRLKDYYDVGPRDQRGKVRTGSVIDPSWHSRILSSILHHNKHKQQLYIVTDDPTDPILTMLSVYNPIIVSNSPAEDFRFIMNFDTILCGNSSFSWFAAFFSEATKIFTFSRWINDQHNKIVRLAEMRGASMQQGSWYKNK
ncbi:MAG TPA: hypothetical protein VMV77_13460, partial [Bacteroidales bacterium]|nr:hypothetical protein [Bacteroidales bacterium]